MATDHEMRMEALRLFEENERLRATLETIKAALGKVKIDIEGCCTHESLDEFYTEVENVVRK
jgi:hypothetical protein